VFPHPRLARHIMRPRLVGFTAVTFAVFVACTDSSADSPRPVNAAPSSVAGDTDDFGMPVPTDARYAARVVSLNPTTTELLFALGVDSLLVGRSRWDTFPRAAQRVPAVGDGIRPNVEAIVAVRPTLVLVYATPENRAAVEALARAGIRTLALRVDRLAQWHQMVQRLGIALGVEATAGLVRDSVQRTLDRVRAATASLTERPRVVWPVWDTPPMVIGAGSYLDELLTIAGATNVFHDRAEPSFTVSMEEIVRRAPDRVIVSAQQAAAFRTRPGWQALPAVREGRFVMENPDLTGRPSVTMGMAAVQLAKALHPQLADRLP